MYSHIWDVCCSMWDVTVLLVPLVLNKPKRVEELKTMGCIVYSAVDQGLRDGRWWNYDPSSATCFGSHLSLKSPTFLL